MKQKIIVLLIVLCTFTVLTALPASAATEGTCGEGITWRFDEESATLTFSGSGTMVADYNPPWHAHSKSTKYVVIEEGITSISESAFHGFKQLMDIQFPNSLQVIHRHAFSGCRSLTSLNFGSSLKSIEEGAFSSCSGLTSLVFPFGVKKIGYSSFSDCSAITTLTIPSSVTTIEPYAFSFCWGLTSVTIPDSVTSLGDSAFNNCKNLSHVQLSSSITKIGNHTFGDCISLTDFYVPDNIKSISDYAFSNCSGITSVSLGSGVSEIGTTAFWGCKNLTQFTVKDSNNAIAAHKGILYNKSKTKLLLIPQGFTGDYQVLPGTTVISAYAAYECTQLTGISFPVNVITIEKYAFTGCSGLRYANFSKGLSRIALYGFARCSSLTEIAFPDTLTEIDSLSFSGCKAITKMTFTGNAPKIGEQAFSDMTAKIYYPSQKPGWENVPGLYGGTPEWVPISCNGNHTNETVPGIPATCQTSGFSDGISCSVCGQVIVVQKYIPTTDHSYGSWKIIQEASEQADGLQERSCTFCSKKEQKAISKTGETATTSPIIAPTIAATTEAVSSVTDYTDSTSPADTSSALTEPQSFDANAHDSTSSGAAWDSVMIVAAVIALGGASTATIIILKRKGIF